MRTGRMILAGIIIWIVNTALIWLTCGWLFNWVYEIPPNIWVGPEVMMSTGNMIGSNLVGLFGAIIFALIYALVYKYIPSKGVKSGMLYGLMVWLVGVLSGMATMPFYMTISTTVIVYWIIQALVLKLITGELLGAIYKE